MTELKPEALQKELGFNLAILCLAARSGFYIKEGSEIKKVELSNRRYGLKKTNFEKSDKKEYYILADNHKVYALSDYGITWALQKYELPVERDIEE